MPLKVIVNQDGVKRQIDGAFEIYVDQHSLRVLRDRLYSIGVEEWSYGWIPIFETPEIDSHPNTPPKPWAE